MHPRNSTSVLPFFKPKHDRYSSLHSVSFVLRFFCEFVSRHLEAHVDVVHLHDDVRHYYYHYEED